MDLDNQITDQSHSKSLSRCEEDTTSSGLTLMNLCLALQTIYGNLMWLRKHITFSMV